MKKEDKDSLESKKFTESLLFACLATCEPVISRYAYSEKKWRNYYMGPCNLGDSYRSSRLEWMEYRKKIRSLLLTRYSMAEIIQMTKACTNKATQKAVKELVEVLDSGDYCLL